MLSSRKPDALDAGGSRHRRRRRHLRGQRRATPTQAAACVAATVARFGRLDVLVNNAATNPY